MENANIWLQTANFNKIASNRHLLLNELIKTHFTNNIDDESQATSAKTLNSKQPNMRSIRKKALSEKPKSVE